MGQLSNLRQHVIKMCQEHPEQKVEITDLFQLCLDEIESGESPENEIQLCYQSIEDLFN